MQQSTSALVVLAASTLLGAAVQAGTGFGFAIIAAPAFLYAIDGLEAVPILVALHLVQSAMLVPRLWSAVPRTEFDKLILGAAIGCVLGIAVFQFLDLRSLKLSIGIVILMMTALLAWRRWHPGAKFRDGGGDGPNEVPPGRSSGLIAGALSGAMTAILVMPGPPLMLYLLRRPIPAVQARALSLTLFAVCYAVVFVLHLATKGLSGHGWQLAAILAPLVVPATWGGERLFRLLTPATYWPVLLILLLLSGLGAIASVL
ncbi:MAG: sulfite exporter TauE/SafE family protein [Hyphomicrobiaceae bacterium]